MKTLEVLTHAFVYADDIIKARVFPATHKTIDDLKIDGLFIRDSTTHPKDKAFVGAILNKRYLLSRPQPLSQLLV